MSVRTRVLKVVALAAVVLTPAVAYADVDGTKGSVDAVTVNESSADDYTSERGSVVINEGTTVRKYQWGGTACNGRNLSESNIALLVDVMMKSRGKDKDKDRDKLEVVPSYKTGAGQARCLVGFRIQVIAPEPAPR